MWCSAIVRSCWRFCGCSGRKMRVWKMCRTSELLVVWCSLWIYAGGCQFPKQWAGSWFQSGVIQHIQINLTHIDAKGECYEEQGEKVVVYDRSDNCYRCMAIHVKHPSVLQYKETFCEPSAQDICNDISGDAPLYSMFRKYPEAKPIPCPFKSAPFTFQYNKGSEECTNPPSKAESCTDDSRLVLKYQACPDVPGTESNVEELICLAVWKEGSTKYLVGKVSQWNRRSLTTDEDQYRCFIYQRVNGRDNEVVYNIAQSGDASCNGLTNALEGSKTMKLRAVDNHHNRCKFPAWITDHHTWLGLDHKRTYKFSLRNATLKIVDEDPKPPARPHHADGYAPPQFAFQTLGFESQEQRKQNAEMRVVCHSILQAVEHRKVQIVAHITHGCDSGYICMVFHKRDNGVIEIQQSGHDAGYEENADDACKNFDPTVAPYTTLITTTLHPKSCPHLGRYTLEPDAPPDGHRRKRQQPTGQRTAPGPGAAGPLDPQPECVSDEFVALAVGCGGSPDVMELRTACAHRPPAAFSCHGSWQENGTHYVVASPLAARRPADSMRYCFVYAFGGANRSRRGAVEGPPPVHVLAISAVAGNCDRDVVPGVRGTWAFNFTSNARRPADSMRYCFLYAFSGANRSRHGAVDGPPPVHVLAISAVAGNCDRDVVSGVRGTWAFNFTSNGTCAESNPTGSGVAGLLLATAAVEAVALAWAVLVVAR